MSLKGNLEFAIQLKQFQNLDLFEPGFFHIRLSITQETNKKKLYARPYAMTERVPAGLEARYSKPAIKPQILAPSSTYVSKTFAMGLNDDEVIFNESCYFRVEFNAFPKLENSIYTLEADLMYIDYTSFSDLKGPDEKKLTSFQKLDSFSGVIKNPELGIHEFTPLFFEFRNSSALEMTFHSTILNLRTVPEIEASYQPDQKGNQKEAALSIQIAKIKSLFPKNLKLTPSILDEFYHQCIFPLRESYQHLLEFYASMLRLYVQESNADIIKKYLEGLPAQKEILKYLGEGMSIEHRKGRIRTFYHSSEEKKIEEDLGSPKKISELLNLSDADLILTAIAEELILIGANLFHTWRSLNDVMLEIPRLVIWNLQRHYNYQLRECFHNKLIQRTYRTPDLSLCFEENKGETHNQIANSKRLNGLTSADYPFSVIDKNVFSSPDTQPIVFEEISIKENLNAYMDNDTIFSNIERNCSKGIYEGVHLIVLCHGFQGNSFDLRLLRNTINFLYPDTFILSASSNEEETEGEISKMGVRLASEVSLYINEWIKDENLGRLSFVGHSLGGLIIRSALPYLEQYSEKMHLFMTFSSAHLGYFNHSSKIVDAGMWLMKQWKGSTCLRELSLSDATNIEDTYLFKLSKKKGLNWFKHVMLLSSFQDHYAPFQSSRIQVTKKVFQDANKQALYEQMASNILSDISADCIYRIDVNFSIQKKTLDSMLGRTAHIQFLESQYLIRMLVWRYANFFC